jgi:hypothetical protein
MGGRMARGSSLSDDRVIDKLNRDFIAVDNNVSDMGFPANTPALQPWQNWFEKHPRNASNGFTTSVVMTPDGKMPLGTSGSGYIDEWANSICYDPAKYYDFLQGAQSKFQTYQRAVQNPDLGSRQIQLRQLYFDIMRENRSRNRGSNRADR